MGLFTGQHPSGGGPLYRQALDLARAAEDSGFDTFWVSEHHGLSDGYLPSPLHLLAALSACTSTIRLGCGLATAPLYHPVRLAEDAAVVDQLSAGRLILGLGLGYARHEYDTFGVDEAGRGARLGDLLSFLRAAWTGDELDWDGPAHRARGLRVTPRPVQEGGVPLWLGGYAPAAVRRAGELADGYLIGRGDAEIVASTTAMLERTRAAIDPSFTVGVNLLVALRTGDGDDAGFRHGFAHQQRTYEQIQRGREVFAGRVPDPTQSLAASEVDRYLHAVGDADQVVESLVRALTPLARWANLHVVLRALVPEVDLAAQLTRVEALGELVVPRLRAALDDVQRTS